MKKQRNRLTNILKFGVFLFGISLLLVNCEKDDFEEGINDNSIITEEINQSKGYTIQRISLEELQGKQRLQKTIKKISKTFDINKTKGEKNTTSKVDATDGSFTILTDEVVQLSTDSTTTYTFKIETPTDELSVFENFTIDVVNDSIIKFYIYKYISVQTLKGDIELSVDYQEVDEDLIEISQFDGLFSKITTNDDCIQIGYGPCSNGGNADGHDEIPGICGGSPVESISFNGCGGRRGGGGGSPTGNNNPNPSGNNETGDTGGYSPSGSGNNNNNTGNTTGTATNSTTGVLLNEGALYLPLLLDLTPEEIRWLENNVTQSNQIYNYVTANGNSLEAISFGELAIIALINEEYNTFEEFIESELNHELDINPNLLIEINCDQIAHWQSLAQHTAPQSAIDKIQGLKDNHEALLGDWDIQYLNEAGGTVVNLDYFAVKITTLPNNPVTGLQFTANEFLDYFRNNINDFSEPLTTFEPYCEISAICQQETDLWNSNNPLGAIVKLDISLYNGLGGNILSNDGVVVCAGYQTDYWRFMTMEAPYDGNHPVTGTRQFGIEQNLDGSYNIYTRGVDRFNSYIQETAIDIFFSDPFAFADNLWEHFQKTTNNFINSNGGISTINTPIHNRPDWDKVKDVLQGNKPISDLGCE